MLEKKYDFKTIEKMIQSYWADKAVYRYDKQVGSEVYSIDTPPPTVSGKIHIGHVFSYSQAEMIARYHRMNGKKVFYPFGFDDNGLPTERLVERDLGIIAKELPREEFIKLCLKTTEKYEQAYKTLWQSMGFSCDWSLAYRTIDETTQRISQRSFIELYNKGKAYMDRQPVLWCTECQTSIAQAELDTVSKQTRFNTLIFSCEGENLEIATTRPELLYGCVAVFVHPEDQRYQHLIGKMSAVPLYDFEVPIMADDRVSMDKGTGIVMCCTFGDTTDLEWYKTYHFEGKEVIDAAGMILEHIPYIGGMSIHKGRKTMIEILETGGLLINYENIDHHVSVHERCGTPIEIMPSKQWYIDILTDKEKYLKAADDLNWYPSQMKNRYTTWVENLKWDWCVSRQRYYGVPIPVWYCRSCGKEKLPSLDELPVNPMSKMPSTPCSCGLNDFEPETAVLDTWATSSVTPDINRKWHEDDEKAEIKPMTLRTQAHEIIRTWAFYSIVKSLEHHDELPWKDMMICGFVLAKKGEKISKSKNNASGTPEGLIETHSADAIRYWAANSRLGTDTMFDPEELKLSKRFLTKLWNASKFSIMQLKDYEKVSCEIMIQDQWILDKYHACVKETKYYLNQYEVGLARQVVDEFFWKDFCDNYLEYVKDRLYKTELYSSESVASGRRTLYTVTLGFLKLYAIFVPHITEHIYLKFFKAYENADSIHLLQWDDKPVEDRNIQLADEIKAIISQVRKYKTEHGMSMKDEINKLCIKTKMPDLILKCSDDLKACLHFKDLEIIKHSELNLKVH